MILFLLLILSGVAFGEKPTALDQYIRESQQRASESPFSPGSLYSPGSRLADLGRDFKASQIDDIVTIVVADKASALSKGTTNSDRKSSAKASVGAIAGLTKVKGPLANLAQSTGEQQLQGQAQTSRDSTLTTTLAARVTHVLPNGNLVLEGVKEIVVNSERQLVTIRGVARGNDLTAGNQVRSDRLAHLEVRVQGKGVVGDAIRRPHLLYRILLGILPF
jgi:flagellar L-ring protein precursor FlgH